MAGTSQGALAARLVLQSDQFKAELGSTASLSERELRRIQKQVQFVNDYIRETARVQKQVTDASGAAARSLNTMTISAAQQANAMRMVPAQITDIVTQLQGGQNPLTIMIQQGGQLRDMFGGFGNMFRGLAASISPVAVAVGGLAAVTGTLAYAYYEGYKDSQAFANAVRLTGNAAGMTESAYRMMASSISASTVTTMGAVKELEQATISTGRIGPANFQAFVTAAAKLQKETGQSADQTVQQLARMSDGVAQWAIEANKQYHFVDAAQIKYIQTLEEQGRKGEAMGVALDALNKHLQTHAGYWDMVGQRASAAWDRIAGIGRAETAADRLDSINRRLANFGAVSDSATNRAQLFSRIYDSLFNGGQKGLEQQRLTANMDMLRDAERAAAAADKARTDEAGINANSFIKRILDQAKGVDLLKDKIAEAKRQFAAAAAAGTPVSADDQKRVLDQLAKQYNPQGVSAGNKLASEFATLSAQLDNQTVKLKAQAEYWQKYGKALDDSAAAVMRFRTQQGDLQKLTDGQKSTLVAKAEAEDVAKRAANLAQETAQAQKRVEVLKAEADAREQSARAAFIEQKAKQALGDSTDALLRKEAEEAAAKLYDRQYADQFARTLGTASAQIDKQVASIDAETSMIGQSASARQHLTDIINVQASAQQLLAKYTDKQTEIDAWAAEKVKALTEARERQAQADRLASNGVASALATYKDNASSTAKLVDQAVTGGLSSMEDALTAFVTTGKLSFKSFADSVVADITRIIIKQQIMNALGMGSGGGGSSIGGWLSTAATALFGGPTSSAPVGFASAAGINGGRASGGPVMSGGIYQVNETGAPEMLESGGRSYLLTGGREGRVTPASQVGGGTNFTQNLYLSVAGSVDSRSAQQVAAASGRAAQRALARNN